VVKDGEVSVFYNLYLLFEDLMAFKDRTRCDLLM